MKAKNPYFLAIRPKTLSASVVPIVLASSLAPIFDGVVFLFSLLTAIFIQIGTNLVNDALDFQKGADTKDRLGPTRVTASGLLPAARVMQGALFAFTLALVMALPLIYKGGWPIAGVLALSVLSGWGYTGGPKPLAYLGLGDLFVILFFGFAATVSVYYLHTGEVSLSAFVLGAQTGALSMVLIGINNLRDVKGDARASKKTVPVRFGVSFGKKLVILELIAPYLLLSFWARDYSLAMALPLIAFPIASWLVLQIVREEPSQKYNQFLGVASLHQLLFALLMAVGFIFA